MFLSYILLLFLLGTSVNAAYTSKYHNYKARSVQVVMITVTGLDVEKGPTRWYRLKYGGAIHDVIRDNDVAQINKDGTVVFFMLGQNGYVDQERHTAMDQARLIWMSGVWGPVPHAGMSIADRNREMSCDHDFKHNQVKCHVQEASIPKSSGTGSVSPPAGYIGDKYAWSRVTPGPDINDVLFDLQPNALPEVGSLLSDGASLRTRRIGVDRMVGTYRVMPSTTVRVENRHVLLIVTAHEEVQTRKSLTKPGQRKVVKQFGIVGKPKTKSVLHYELVHM